MQRMQPDGLLWCWLPSTVMYALVRALLAAGADVNAVDETGSSALMEAAAFGHRDAVEALILEGADVNLKNKAGAGALKRAVLGKHKAIEQLLQDSGATEGGD